MNKRKVDALLESAYDGIQEYDNDLPRWWIQLFWITIVIGGLYSAYVHLGYAPSDADVLASEMKALEVQRATFQNAHAPKISGPEQLLALAADTGHVAHGKELFTQKCAACHGQKAEGLVGPNLTDEFWVHGGRIEQVRNTISEGVPAKGMLTWKTILSQGEIDDLTAFLWTIRNTNLPGKAPEGTQ